MSRLWIGVAEPCCRGTAVAVLRRLSGLARLTGPRVPSGRAPTQSAAESRFPRGELPGYLDYVTPLSVRTSLSIHMVWPSPLNKGRKAGPRS